MMYNFSIPACQIQILRAVGTREYVAGAPRLHVTEAMTAQAEWLRRWQPTLESQPWRILRIRATVYLLKSQFSATSYVVCLCDFQTVYQEKLTNKELLRRFKVLNPKVEAPLSRLLSHLSQSLQQSDTDCQWSVECRSDNEAGILVATIRSQLSVLPFIWEFHLQKTGDNALQHQLLFPLLAMVGELSRRETNLKKLLEAKDREIEDYKASGAQISRRTLRTLKFDEKAFTNEMNFSMEFEQVVCRCQTQTFEQIECRDLYKQVMIKDAFLNRQTASLSPDEGDSLFGLLPSMDDSGKSVSLPTGQREGTAGGSWSNRLPPSLVPESQSENHKTEPFKSTDGSPNALSSTALSGDTEVQARAAIAKRLANEAEKEKGKKKRKKLL